MGRSRILASPLVALALGLAPLILAPAAHADESDTAFARQVHAEVNGRLDALTGVAFSARRPDADHTSEVKAWADASGVRKIEATDRDDSGEVVTEYFYAKGALVFAYQAIRSFNASGKQVTRIENRQYFSNGRMHHWLGGMDKLASDPADAGFMQESKVRTQASGFYLRAAQLELARRPSLCAPEEEIVFSCAASGKRISICASRDASPTQGYLQYRYGKPFAPSDSLELSLPETRTVPPASASGENVAFSDGGGSWLRFAKADQAYVAYSGIGRWGPRGEAHEKSGIAIERGGKRVAVLKCGGRPESLPGAEWFERMGIAAQGGEFDFPD